MASPLLAANDLSKVYTPGAALGGSTATIGKLVSPLIQNFLILAGVGTFIYLLFSGFAYITAGGDKQKIENANQSVTYGIIGLSLIVSAYLITLLIGKIVGGANFNIFNPN